MAAAGTSGLRLTTMTEIGVFVLILRARKFFGLIRSSGAGRRARRKMRGRFSPAPPIKLPPCQVRPCLPYGAANEYFVVVHWWRGRERPRIDGGHGGPPHGTSHCQKIHKF